LINLVDDAGSCEIWRQGWRQMSNVVLNLFLGLQLLTDEIRNSSHCLKVERWLRKQFKNLMNPKTATISQRFIKPFINKLQYEVSMKQLQEFTDVLNHFALCSCIIFLLGRAKF
jgi:hypothetical protein